MIITQWYDSWRIMVWGLVVEDDAADATMVSRAFEIVDADLVIEVARTAEQGLDRLEAAVAEGHRPAFALFDTRLPGMSGLDALHNVRARRGLRDIPVAIYTGSTLKADAERARAAGADHFFVKPLDFDELIRHCKWIHGSWVQLHRAR